MIFLKKLHKWVGLLIGIQVFLWLLSGLMMSLLNPVKVSGDFWARDTAPVPVSPLYGTLLELDDLPAEQLVGVLGVDLQVTGGLPFYRISRMDGVRLINAADGTIFSVSEHQAEQLAREDYTGNGVPVAIRSGVAPDMETRGRNGHFWRVDFSDTVHTSIYISSSTGEIMERRNRYWRIFDFFWMLHIMDYSGRQDFNNPIIIIVALVSIWLGISGFILLFSSFKRRDFDLLGKLRARGSVLVTLIDPAISTPQQVRLKHGGNLFLSLAAANITLPSNCGGGGSCGLCLVQMESSELSTPNASERDHIPRHLLEQGFRLSCQHEVAHNITLRLDEGTIASDDITATVKEVRYVTPFIREILLTTDQPLNFAAGSFFQVKIPAHEVHLKTPESYASEWERLSFSSVSRSAVSLRRAYSAANYAGEFENGLMLNVRFQPPPKAEPTAPVGTGSTWIHTLEPGETVHLTGPYGHFHAQETQREMVCIGGGAGMGPLRSIIMDQLVNRSSRRKISFWYGARNRREVFYQQLFDQLVKEHDNFDWTVVLSALDPDDGWQGPRGFVHKVVYDNYLAEHPNLDHCEFYICGPPPMLLATLEMLAELGVSPDAIRYDDFGN